MSDDLAPIELYIPPESHGAIPNFSRWRLIDPDIDKKLRVHANYRKRLQDLPPGSVVCLSIQLTQLIPELTKKGLRIIVYIGEPPRDFDQYLASLDHKNVCVILSGAANYRFQYARFFRVETFFGEIRQFYTHLKDELRGFEIQVKPFYFDALLGTAERSPRSWIKEELESRHPGKNIVRVYPKHPPSAYLFSQMSDDHYLWPEGVDFTGLEDQPFFAAQMVKYKGIPAMICMILPWNVYEQTAYSIVAETHVDNAWNFYTEKTAKPIMARRLFVAFAGQYHLKNLRALGFRTFDSVIDESYDLEPNPELRWDMAMQQVCYLCDQDQARILAQIQDIVEHNFQVMQATDWRKQSNDLIIDLALDKNY